MNFGREKEAAIPEKEGNSMGTAWTSGLTGKKRDVE